METECTAKKGDWTSRWVVKNLSINWLTSCTVSAKLGAEVPNKQVVDEQSKVLLEICNSSIFCLELKKTPMCI
jgi:hypothetical protein